MNEKLMFGNIIIYLIEIKAFWKYLHNVLQYPFNVKIRGKKVKWLE